MTARHAFLVRLADNIPPGDTRVADTLRMIKGVVRVDQAPDDLRRQLARVCELHGRYRDVEAVGDDDSCAHCNQLTGHRVPWPCPTIQALETT